MKMELSVPERMVLSGAIPKQGNMVTYRLILALREAIGFSEDEIIKWQPTLCQDISNGCPRCSGTEWEGLPFYSAKKCVDCGFLAAQGEPGLMTFRTLDKTGEPISDTAEIEFGEAGMELIVETLKLFDKNQELDDNTAPLYVKFVEKTGASDGDKG